MPEEIDRQLVTMSLFYASRNQHKAAEELIVQVLDKLDKDKSSDAVSYNLVMALSFYGRILLANPKREAEARDYLK